jgi:hypothetical protein
MLELGAIPFKIASDFKTTKPTGFLPSKMAPLKSSRGLCRELEDFAPWLHAMR